METPDRAPPFVVGLVAPHDFDAPGLADALDRLLLGLTAKKRHLTIVVCSVMNQPASVAAGEVCRRHGWLEQWRVPDPDGSRGLAVLREGVAIAATAGAVVLLVGGCVPESTRRLAWLCAWLGTPHRVARIGG